MKSFEIKITGNAKSLVDSIKSSQSAMDALIKGIDKAEKKLEVLTQTGSHLSNIDKQLAKLKTDYPDIFEKIFPNIDSQINESMKPILQMPELVEQTMTKVAQKMKAIDNGTLKATDEDIKELGNDMRLLGETLHLENLDMSFLDGTAKAETKIKRLIDTMGKLVEAYFNVNKAATSVDMGEVVPKKKTQKKSKNEDKPELTVNALRKKVEEIKSLSEKALDDDDAFDLVDKKTQSLIKMFKVSDDIAAKLEVELQDVDKSIEETMSKLEKMLGNQFPKAMGNAADAADGVDKKIQKLLPTSEGLEKLRIIPDGDQKAKISEYAEEYRVILKLLQQGNIESKETISALRERARTLKNIIQGVNPGDTTLDKLLTDGYGISKGTANTVASTKLASKFKIDEFKSENISNDAREKAINLIHQEIIAENKLAKKIEEERSAIDGKNSVLKKSSQLIEKILLDESKSEKFLYVNTDKGTSSDIAIGTEHGLTKDQRESLLEPFGGPSQFNATLHTHPEKIAAPSGKNGDLDIFLNDFDKFKKNFILAGEQLAEIDFSSLTKEQVEKIKDAFILKESDIDPMDFDNLLMKDIATLSPEISTELSKWMKMNLSSLIPDKTKENIGDEQIINDAIETYIENVCAFIKNGNIGDLSHEDFMLEMDRVATETLSTYSDNVKKGLRSIFAGNASDAFDEISGAKQSLQDELQQALQNAFIQSIKEVGLDASKIFKLYDAKNFDFETFKPKATSTQEPATKPTESNSGNIQADADAHKENTDAINTENNAIDSNTKAMQENSDAANANAEALKKRNEENKQAEQIASDSLDAFRALQNEILGKSAAAEGGSMDGEAIGRYTERVEAAKAKLDELAKQSLLTADQIKEANDIYETAIGNLEGKSRTNKEHYDNLAENTGREPAGSYDSGYDSGYDKGYNDAYNNARADVEDELESLRTQLAEARADLSRTQTSIDSGTPIDTSVELQNLEKLRAKLEEVKNTIISKNKAFNDEGVIVGQVVSKEIRTLDLLLNKINDITNAINTKTESFQTEGNAVSESVKQAAKPKENNKVSNTPTFTSTPTSTKKVTASQKESFNDLLRLQKKYYGAQEALENASTSKKKSAIRKNRDELKKQYEERLKNAKLTAEQQAKLDEKTEDHNRKIAVIRANNEDKADKNANAQNEKQVNEIYQRREDIISEIIKRQKELNSVATEEGKAAAEDALNAATDKLRQINEEIDNSGLVFDDKKLSAQNDKLANSIANANKSNFIKEQESVGKEKIAQQKKDFEELLALQKKYYDTQKALENGVGTVKEEELVRKATEAEDLYNKKKQEVKLTQEQENQLLEKQAELERELAGVKTDKETTSASVTAKAKQDGILNAIKQEVSKSYKSTGISVLDEVPEELANTKVAYDALIDKINDYKSKGVALSDDIIKGLKEEAKAIKTVMDAYAEKTKQQAKSDAKQNSENQKPAYKNSIMNSLRKKYFQSYGVATSEEFAISPSVISAAEKLKSTWEELNRLNKEIGNTKPTEAQEIAFSRLTDEFNQAKKELDGIISSTRKLSEKSLGTFDLFDAEGKSEFDLTDTEDRKRALLEAVNTLSEGKAKIGEFDTAYKELNYTVKNADGNWVDMKASINAAGTAIEVVAGKTKSNTSAIGQFVDQLKDKFKSIAQYLISMAGYQEIIQQIRKGIQYVREIDSALTELKKVTDETDATYAQFLKTMSQTGSEVGATISDLTNMAANWARLGYNIQEAGELAKSTAVLLNVSEFKSADEASEALISTMQAYGYAAEDSMHVVDVLNEIGNNFAVSSDGLATALQDSASSLMAAGNNLEQSVAMVAAANKVLQDPSSVGSALRTISLRIRGTSVKVLEEMGEETDGVIESVSKLQAKVKGLSGVDILTDTGAYKDTYTIIKEIGQVWDKMNDINRAALLELLAGKNRSNAMAALLTNMEDLEGAYEDAMAAQGSAEAENEKYMNSIQGRIDQFTNSLQTMWSNAISSDFVKFIISASTGIVKLVDSLGMIPTILGTIAGAMSAIKGQNLFVNLTGNGKSGVITELIQNVKEGIPAIKEFNSIQGVDNQAKFLNSLKETNPELSDYITKIMAASSVTTENGVATNIASASQSGYIRSLVAAKAASIGLKVATVALNAALTIGVSLLISGAISAISKAINGVKEAKEETKKLTEELKQQQAEIKSNISSLESLKDEFDKLSKGVDEYGNNISLSTEEYSKYKSIVEQIIGYTPILISGYDEEGNAIANKNNLIEKSIELLREERKQKLLDLVTDDKLKVAYSSSKESYDKAEERLKNIDIPSTLAYSGVKIDDNGKEHSGYVNQIDKYIEDVIGIEKNASESITEYITRNYDAVRKNIGKIIERSGQTKDGWKGLNEKQQTELLSYLNNVLSGVRETDSAWDSFIQTLQLVPQISAYYDKLSDSQKSFIASYINGIDDLENKTEEEVSSIKNGILSLTNAIGSDKEAQSLIDQLFSIDSNLSAKEYSDKISEIFNKLIEKGTISNDDKQKFINQLFPDLKDIETMQTKVKEKVKDGQKDLVNSLNAQDLKIAYSIDVSNVSFDELKKSIQDVKVANIGDFNISDYSDSISSLSENIGVLQAALEKLNSGQFTMDDYVKLIKDFPKLAKGVDVSSKSFKGLTSNLVRAIKASPKSMVKDLKALKLQLMQTGRSTSDIDQLIYSLEHMPENALDSIIAKYETLAEEIKDATEAQLELKAAMEENPNEGFETRGEAMDYMKEAMSRGEIGSESNLWNVAEKYGFTFDSAKSINENADALAKFIATREKWFKQDDDGNYTYEGTEDFIKKVDAAVASMPELQELMKWDYNENTGVLDFDFKNKDWDQIVKYLSTCEGLIGLTSDEWADMLVQVGQYFNIDWSNYNDELEYLKKITTEDTDNKSKVEKYGSAMQEYFGKDSSIDLANRPMVSSSKMKAKGWDVEDGSYATVLSGAYSNEGETAAITVTPILPDGEILTEEELTKYATEIVNGADPATYEFEVNGKTYTGEDIILAKHNGKDPIEEAKEYGQALHEAQEEYDKLRDTLNINTTIDEKGIEGLSEIKEIQSAIQKNADGTTIIDEQAFRKALTSAEYTEDQVNLIIDKIKSLNSEVFASDTFNLNKIFTTVSTTPVIDQLLEIQELQGAIKKDAKTGFAVIDTDMFTSVLSEAGYTKTQIDELIQKIQEYEGIVSVSGNTDPLGLNSAGLSIDSLKASLSTLGVFFEDNLGDWFDGKKDLKINVPDLVSTLKEKGWSEEAIRSYCEQLSQANIEGFNIKVNSQEIDEALAKSEDVPEEKSTNYEVTGDGTTTLENIDNKWGEVTQDKTTNYTIVETTVKKTVEEDDSEANGTAVWYKPWMWFSSADGTANAQGNWGVAQDETSLVGELGTELLVRNGKWTTIGENGAEFANIKKGDIIFNHKQTEELLKNGHISSRGKAYANGTAYVVGNSAFARYGFSGNGGYQKFDVNGNVVDTFGNAANAISDAADSMSDAADKFDETIDWFEILLEEIESDISLMNAQLENAVGRSAKKGIYSQILNAEHYKVQELNEGIKLYSDYSAKLLAKIPEQYREMAKNGAVAIKEFVGEENEEVVEAINNYREWANKVKDLNQQLEETKKQISETRVQIQEMVKTEYTNEIGLTTVKNDQIQSAIDLLEEQGERASDVFYKAMTENSNTQLKKLQEQREKMQEELDKAVKSGDVKKFSEDWYSMVNAIYEVDASIIDCETDIEGFQNAINDLHWENFDKIITAIDNVSDEAEQLRGLIDDDDIADDVGNWTSDGITSLGLLAQEMEKAKYRAELYGEQIEQLNKDYAAGKYSTDEYNEKLKELKDSQYDSIDAMKSAKKSIIDVNKTRIEAVKNGIQKEIDAYEKLISKRKEDLSSQKDAHDWAKTLKEHNDEIDKIQRQIDAMSGDNSAAATAKRKKLEAELAEAQSSLNEDLYSHDIETQQNALDKELDAYKENQDKKMEELDNYLKNEEQVLADSLKLILENADGIDAFLKNISEEYGVSIYDAVVDPWSDGADALARYLEMLKELRGEQEGIQKETDSNANDTVNNINKSTTDTTSAEYVEPPKPEPKPSRPSSGGGYYAPSSVGVGSAVTVKSNATNFSRDGGNGTKMQGWVPGSTFTVMETSGDQVLIGIPGSGYTGWVNKNDLVGFAKGTKGVKSSQLAMIDENGLEELVLHADGNGKLAFLSKGTSVIPADLTENLMKLGSIDPTEMLKRNTPSIGAPHITNNNMELNVEFGSLVHVDHCDQNTLPELKEMVRSEFDNMVKKLNSGLKRYTR